VADNSFIDHIKSRLAPLDPIHLEIKDDSARHAGHIGARPDASSHFSVRIVSAAFEGLAPAARHRLIYAALAEEMKGKIHALAIETMTLQEYNQKYT
jgi:BolA protein